MRHIPVLPDEVIESLNLRSNMNAIDCTLGDGGHAERILKATGPNGKLLGIDADPESLLRAKKYLYGFGRRLVPVRDNFDRLSAIVAETKFGKADAIVLDLGWSSPQFEERGRGFSFQKEEPLDMRYNPEFKMQNSEFRLQTASDLVNELSEEELERIFREYGEEDLSAEIARAIAAEREARRMETTNDLVAIVLEAYRKKLKTKKEMPWVGGLHPATKIFQALRIAVNDELGALERVLPQAVESLAPRGRLAVITFHSLEDRIVKHFFKSEEGRTMRIVTKKPVTAGEIEYEENPRARSAKLRIIEKI